MYGAVGLGLGALVLSACGSPSSSGGGDHSTASTASGGGASSSGGAPGTGGAASGSGPSFGGGTFSESPPTLTPDAACAATTQMAEQVVTEVQVPVEVPVEEVIEVPVEVTVTTYLPFDMYVMYDQSGSMGGDTPVGTKWNAIEAALTGFLNDPGSDGIGVGIGYFPFVDPAAPAVCFQDSDCGAYGPCVPVLLVGYCQGADACDPSMYATPEVPIEDIPTVVPKITSSLNAHGPGGGTPTAPALQGALDYAIPWAAAHPDRKTIVVLATDGDPSGCTGNSVQDVANIAASGLTASPPVQTFVIGVGSSLTSLNSIAASGGTSQAFIVDATTGDPTQQFIDAMNAIRESVTTTETHTETQIQTHTETHMETQMQVQTTPVDCQWGIPTPPDGESFDQDQVNVQFSSDSGSPQRIGYVDSKDGCAAAEGGWYYDDNAAPSSILVCDQTCNILTAITSARVDILLGCATEPAILK
jgi:hypothetical protein